MLPEQNKGTRPSMLQRFSQVSKRSSEVRLYDVEFAGMPLGIDVESAISQKNLFVKGSSDDRVQIGSQIVKVGGKDVVDWLAPQIVTLISRGEFPVMLTFRQKLRQKTLSLRSPRSTARIEFVDGTSRLIPMHEMTVKAVIDFIWATGDFDGQVEHYGMYVIDKHRSGSSFLVNTRSEKSVTEEIEGLELEREFATKFEFRVKDEYEGQYQIEDTEQFYGPWLTLDNEQITFDLNNGVALLQDGSQCLLKWKGPNVVQIELGTFTKICKINEDGQLEFKTGEIWVPYDATYLGTTGSRLRKVSTAQVLLDINITKIPHGLRYKIADSGQVIITHVTEGSEADENGVKFGDVITGINDEKVRDPKTIMTALGEMNEPFVLQVSRLRGRSIARHPDDLSALPELENNGFLRIYLGADNPNSITVPCINSTTVNDIRQYILEEKGEDIPVDWYLFVSGCQDLRNFSTVLDDNNFPLEVRKAITKDGQYSVKFVFKDNADEEDSYSDSDFSSDVDEAVPEAPKQGLIRKSNMKDWGTEDLDAVGAEMLEALHAMQKEMSNPAQVMGDDGDQPQPGAEIIDAELEGGPDILGHEMNGIFAEGSRNTPIGEHVPADPQIVQERIALVEEAVRKQWLIAEALHDFDKDSIPNWPDYSTLQNLQQGDMLLVSKRDPTGWWKGKNIMGGDQTQDGAYFPGSYVEVVAKPLYLARACHKFHPGSVKNFPPNMVLLTLDPEDILIVTDTHESGWWRGCNLLGGAEGYFPRDFVEITAQPDLQNDQWEDMFKGDLKHKGGMDKKARVMRKWRSHWFVYHGEFLYYYDTENSNPKNPIGKIRIIDGKVRCQVIPDPTNDRKFVIKDIRKEWELRTPAGDREKWLRILMER